MDHRTAATEALTGEELLVFLQGEPTKLQLAQTITELADENARLKKERRRLLAYILEERDGSGKSALDWINLSRLAAAHFALTEAGYSYKDAANRLIKSAPKIIDLLKVTQRAKSFGAQERLIQLRKNFQNNRATKIQAAKDAFQYALMAINKHKSDPEKLVQLAAALILAVDPLQRPLF